MFRYGYMDMSMSSRDVECSRLFYLRRNVRWVRTAALACLALRRRSKRRPHDAANIVVIHLSLVWRGHSTVCWRGTSSTSFIRRNASRASSAEEGLGE